MTDSSGYRGVVVSTDGGRLRIRKDKHGPRTKKGRRRYHVRWKKPKLIIIFAVDSQGKMDRRFIPVIERMLKGQTDKLIAAIKAFCRGRNSKDIAGERNYFMRIQNRMNYKMVAGLKLPIGSGAMKSAVRRVVNLRMKGASKYWLDKTANVFMYVTVHCFTEQRAHIM